MSFLQFLAARRTELMALAAQHLVLVAASTALAVAAGHPLGILMTRWTRLARPILAVAGLVQTIPSLALFGFLIPLPLLGGIGTRTALVALTLYALLPILQNTYAGIGQVDRTVLEAATALGMTDGQRLRMVELPLALPVILAGVRIAAVVSVGTATIAKAGYPDPTQFDPASDGHDPASKPEAPRWYVVDVKLDQVFPRAVPLDEIRGVPALKDMVLLQRSRLSVQPVTADEWKTIVKLGGGKG